jgi:hypothetical protein
MASFPAIRGPQNDHLLTPQNAALVIIDYQPVQVSSKLFGLPTVVATVNVVTGRNQPTIRQVAEIFPDIVPIDRTSINAWEDADFVAVSGDRCGRGHLARGP